MKNKNKNLDHRLFTFAFFPGTSLMHKLNPISKIMFLVLLTILIFIIRSLILLSTIFILIVILALVSNISLKNLIRKLKFIIIILFISIILNIFFNAIPSNQETVLFYLFNIPYLPIRRLAVYYALRASIIVLILYSSTIIYTNTTSPKDFLYSLVKLKLPYKYCFSLMVGMRYIPSIEQEAKTIALAQKARGFGLEKANSVKKAYKLIFERLVATLISILRKGHITSISMENRCFGIYKKRTNLKLITFKLIDITFIILCSFVFLLVTLYVFRILPIPQLPSLYQIYLIIF
ncbi:MAG: energy-coupling factor transporter transmembrane component T family protein [Promethearchaeota archaeon]